MFAIYRPPSGKLDPVLELISSAIELRKVEWSGETMVIGDMNVDFAKGNAPARKVIKVMDKWFLSQHNKDHTRMTNTTVSTIDLAF